jgi:hypothetical protein
MIGILSMNRSGLIVWPASEDIWRIVSECPGAESLHAFNDQEFTALKSAVAAPQLQLDPPGD